ncbi:S-adenosyl-L-methionine-dependent methyltransferase [Favolaschia claudopus]|uniref:S-adenosyl-L-methionine-dependent methyltransferase n=1 Tax=Favolaschia claudopus TaxID=2862362 RepID=A0AAW0AXL1_9AGAR
MQHNSLKKIFDDKILLAPVTLTAKDRVLEIGTGPGLWLMEYAQTVDPSVNFVGVDISSRLFPVSAPANIKFQIESVLNLPVEWTNTFALVHQRLLMMALQIPEWKQAIGEIYRVMRPGGWVQIGECFAWIEGEAPDKPCMMKLIDMYWSLIRLRKIWIECAASGLLPEMLRAAGFVDVRSEKRDMPIGKWAGDIGVANSITHAGVFRGIKGPILEAGGFGQVTTEAEYDALVEGVMKEWDDIPGTRRPFEIYWARKPESP